MRLDYRKSIANDAEQCIEMRGKTRQNPASREYLASLGITVDTWGEGIRTGALRGHVAWSGADMVGYCYGDSDSGEVIVLAVLPDFEDQGVGREVLNRVVDELAGLGHRRLFLGCSPDPASRSHGFYRHLGWRSTGTFDARRDEILELFTDA